MLAIKTLAVLAPILNHIDPDLIYRIVRPYFNAGWTARDVHYAMNFLPGGQAHYQQGTAWVRSETRDVTLGRLQRRLRDWRWRDQADNGGADIMMGPDTAMVTAMATHAETQRINTDRRRTAELLERESALLARDRGASAEARRIAATAATHARRARRAAEDRERERLAEEIARSRAASAAWLTQHDAPVQAGVS